MTYVDYLQEARLDLLRHHDTSPTPNPGEGLVVVRTVVDYLRPIRLADAPLLIDTWVCEVRAASFTVAYELRTGPTDEQVVHARATTVLAPFVFDDRTPATAVGRRAGPPADDVRRAAVRRRARRPAGRVA